MLLGTAMVFLLVFYLVARNISAYETQPSPLMVGYRLVVSSALVIPGAFLLVWAARSGDWRTGLERIALLLGWFLTALVASFVLGV